MLETFHFILAFLIGGMGQIVDGILGMGFGLIASSSLVAVGFAPALAVAMINVAKVVTGLASGLSHWRFGNVRRDWLIPLVAGGIVGGIAGGYIITGVKPETARYWVGFLLVLMGGLVVWRTLRWKIYCSLKGKGRECPECPIYNNGNGLLEKNRNHTLIKLGGLGFVAALINGLSGAYGPMATTGVLLLEKTSPRYAIGTVNMAEFFVALSVSTTIIARLSFSQFPFGLTLALALGGVLVAPVAAYICRILTPRLLSLMIGITVIGINVLSVFLLMQ